MGEIVKDFFNDLGIYAWVFLVGLVGGVLNFTSDKKNTALKNTLNLVIGAITSAFLGWIVFEFSAYFTTNERLSLAMTGFSAWKGTEWINDFFSRIIASKFNQFEKDKKDIK